MPELGKWNVIDQLAENYHSTSPYAYVLNNPVMLTDPDGRKVAPIDQFDGSVPSGGLMAYYSGGGYSTYGSLDNYLGNQNPFKAMMSGGGGNERGSNGEAKTFGETQAYKDLMATLRIGGTGGLISINGWYKWWTDVPDSYDDEGNFFKGVGEYHMQKLHNNFGGRNSMKLGNSNAPVDYSGTIMMAGLGASGVLMADDVTVVGVADDVAIVPILAVAAVAAITAKATYEIQKIMDRQKGPQGFQYSLRATTSGLYPVYSSGSALPTGTKYLNAGDVWKYGETIQGISRYTQEYYQKNNLEIYPEFYGSQMQIKIVEKSKIYGYFLIHGELPAGNKIFR